jgi:hypothetical protein
MPRRPFVLAVLVVCSVLLAPPQASGQTAAADTLSAVTVPDTATPSPVEAVEKVLVCARDQGHAADFTVLRDDFLLGRLYLWRPHLQNIDAQEYDVLVVDVRPGSTDKPPLLDVHAFALVGRAPISTSSDQSRPPTARALGLRNKIRKACRPSSSAH